MDHPQQPKVIPLLTPIAFLGMVFAVSAGTVTSSHARSMGEIERSKELRICISPIDPSVASAVPAKCRDKCAFSGPVHEQALSFASSLGKGIQAKFLRVDWDEQFFNKEGKTVLDATYTPELLASGKCDLYPSNLTRNEWRMKKIDFVTLFPSRMMVIVSSAMKGKLKAAPDLAGKTAAIEKGTSYETWLREQNRTSYAASPVKVLLLDMKESLSAVEVGKADFTLADSDAAIWAVRHQLKNATTAFTVGPTDEIGWAFRKEDKDLQAAAQKFVDEQRKSDTSSFNQIWEKYFGISLNKFVSLINSTR
ncbi:MAG: transporter substrate-binding domain-containing protein [Rhodocyclaceae bacterium]|nr:transporter substrate-binding domain-containing protein [Rhodocyclaceae bacterium]